MLILFATFSPVISIHCFIGFPICCNAMHWLEARSACVMMWGVTTRRIKGTRLAHPIRSSYGRDRLRRTEPSRRASALNLAEKDAPVRRQDARRSRARPTDSGGVGGGIIWSVWQPTGRYQLLQKTMPDVHQKQKPRESKCHAPDAFAVYIVTACGKMRLIGFCVYWFSRVAAICRCE